MWDRGGRRTTRKGPDRPRRRKVHDDKKPTGPHVGDIRHGGPYTASKYTLRAPGAPYCVASPLYRRKENLSLSRYHGVRGRLLPTSRRGYFRAVSGLGLRSERRRSFARSTDEALVGTVHTTSPSEWWDPLICPYPRTHTLSGSVSLSFPPDTTILSNVYRTPTPSPRSVHSERSGQDFGT